MESIIKVILILFCIKKRMVCLSYNELELEWIIQQPGIPSLREKCPYSELSKITPNKDVFYVVLYRKILATIARSVSKYISIITGQKLTFSLKTFVVNVNKRLREDFIFCAVSLSSQNKFK